jgi:hypothetical protein
MNKPITYLIIAIVALAVLISAGPTLVTLTHAAVPLIVAVGIVAVVLRLVFFHTRH